MSLNHRIAQPGDICLLLTPTAQELQRVQQYQLKMQALYGGRIFDHIHITCQRFSPENGRTIDEIIDHLNIEINKLKSFPVIPDKIIQFRAPFWQTQVLRWRVQETDAWLKFQHQLRAILSAIDCPSHYDRIRRATCTALVLDTIVNLDQNNVSEILPTHLFMASQVVISRVSTQNEFEYLGTVELDNAISHTL